MKLSTRLFGDVSALLLMRARSGSGLCAGAQPSAVLAQRARATHALSLDAIGGLCRRDTDAVAA